MSLFSLKDTNLINIFHCKNHLNCFIYLYMFVLIKHNKDLFRAYISDVFGLNHSHKKNYLNRTCVQ